MKFIDSALDINFKKILLRADLDVPFKDGKIADYFRLNCLDDTLKFLISKNCKITIIGHIGRPKGQFVKELSTTQLIPYFRLKYPNGNIEIKENLRFDEREELGSDSFAKELSKDQDIYVNDSFATSHRDHTSITKITKYLPSYGGLRLKKEIINLNKVINNPAKPLTVVIGGAKIESKLPLVEKFINIADYILVGGKIALDWQQPPHKKIILPIDFVDTKDIGTNSIELFNKYILVSKTILWAGPLGMWEDTKYINGTKSIANSIIKGGGFSVVGGGDTLSALTYLKLLDKFSFASSGGSAMLEYLVNQSLIGLRYLNG